MPEPENLQTLQFYVIANACAAFTRLTNDDALRPHILPFAYPALKNALAAATATQAGGLPVVMARSEDVEALDQRLLMTEWIANVARGIIKGSIAVPAGTTRIAIALSRALCYLANVITVLCG